MIAYYLLVKTLDANAVFRVDDCTASFLEFNLEKKALHIVVYCYKLAFLFSFIWNSTFLSISCGAERHYSLDIYI